MNGTTKAPQALLRSAVASAALFSCGLVSNAQTYYYIEQIVVSPSAPTTSDAVSLTVNGSLSSTAAYIVNTGFNVIGNTVQLNINASTQGIGLDVLVPHPESFSLGMLAAGTYSITLGGSAILDSASPAEHSFTVSGGGATDCDSLDIISIHWAAFDQARIIVTAANGSSDLFDYPGFVLLDTEGDTIAKETVNYFGIGQNPQQHPLEMVPGYVVDGDIITGELHLWSGFYTEQECQWSGTWELCPASECTTVFPYLWNLGNALVEVDIPYSISDPDGQISATGVFHLEADSQSVFTDVCLVPDNYTLQLDQIGQVGGQLVFGVSASPMGNEQLQAQYIQGTATNELEFTLFGACIDDSNGIKDQIAAPGLNWAIDGDRLIVRATDLSRIGLYRLLDSEGRILRTGSINADTGEVSLAGLASGLYVLSGDRPGPIRFVR